MKKLLFAGIFCLAITSTALSQADELKKKIIDSTCECLNNIPGIETKTKEEIQILIGECMVKTSMNNFIKLAEEKNIDLSDQEGMKQLGIEIGVDMIKSDCKIIQKIMLGIANKSIKEDNTPAKTDDYKNSLITGKILAVNYDPFLTLTIESPSEQITLIWSNYVANGDDFINNLESLKSKTFTFNYIQQKVYNVKLKKYTTVNLITKISQ